MALPKFNDIPEYEMIIPSTQKRVKFRPFLVKEQKVLLIALESQDEKQILNAITNTIESCVLDPIKVSSLSTFDVEYAFVQIRMKSAGEKSTVGIPCQACGEFTQIDILLDDVKIDIPDNLEDIELSQGWSLKLRYPKYQAMLEESLNEETTVVGQLYHLITSCIECVYSEDERIEFEDNTKEEIEEFLNQLTTEQFDKIVTFTQALPKLRHPVEFECEHCGEKQTRVLEGLADFFQLPSPTTP